MESADIQRFDESRTHRRSDDKKPIGLSMVRREFGKELIVGHARRCGQVEFRTDLRPDQLGNLGRRGDAIKVIGYIEIGVKSLPTVTPLFASNRDPSEGCGSGLYM